MCAKFKVRLVDTGKKLDCNTENVYEYCGKRNSFFDLPPRCFECALAEIQPSQIRYPNGIWSSEAIALFERETTKRIIELEVTLNNINVNNLNPSLRNIQLIADLLRCQWKSKCICIVSKHTREF